MTSPRSICRMQIFGWIRKMSLACNTWQTTSPDGSMRYCMEMICPREITSSWSAADSSDRQYRPRPWTCLPQKWQKCDDLWRDLSWILVSLRTALLTWSCIELIERISPSTVSLSVSAGQSSLFFRGAGIAVKLDTIEGKQVSLLV